MKAITPYSSIPILNHPIEYHFISHLVTTTNNTRCISNPLQLSPRPTHFIWTLVVDLDETLISGRDGVHIWVRPCAREFLKVVSEIKNPFNENQRAIELIAWSAGISKHVDICLKVLDPDETIFQAGICRGTSWYLTSHEINENIRKLENKKAECGATTIYNIKKIKNINKKIQKYKKKLSFPFLNIAIKNIGLLPGRADSSIIIDDSPFVAVSSGGRSLILPGFYPYNPLSSGDTTLLFIINIVLYIHSVFITNLIFQNKRNTEISSELQTPINLIGCIIEKSDVDLFVNSTKEMFSAKILHALITSTNKEELPERTARALTHIAKSLTNIDLSEEIITTAAITATIIQKYQSLPDWCIGPSCGSVYPDYGTEKISAHGRIIKKRNMKELDSSTISLLLKSHPFVMIHEIPTGHSSITAPILDVVDSCRLGERITRFLKTFAPL